MRQNKQSPRGEKALVRILAADRTEVLHDNGKDVIVGIYHISSAILSPALVHGERLLASAVSDGGWSGGVNVAANKPELTVGSGECNSSRQCNVGALRRSAP